MVLAHTGFVFSSGENKWLKSYNESYNQTRKRFSFSFLKKGRWRINIVLRPWKLTPLHSKNWNDTNFNIAFKRDFSFRIPFQKAEKLIFFWLIFFTSAYQEW